MHKEGSIFLIFFLGFSSLLIELLVTNTISLRELLNFIIYIMMSFFIFLVLGLLFLVLWEEITKEE